MSSNIQKIILWLQIVVLLLMGSKSITAVRFKFTNVRCEDFDVKFTRFETCKLTVPRRGVVTLNLYLGIYKSPVTNISINMALYKRANGYQPYLFNKSAELCAYLARRNNYPLMHVIFSMFVQNSNINHTCPYSDYVVVKDLVLEEAMFQLLPLPNGQYLFKMLLYAYNDLKESIQVFFIRSD